MKSRSETGVTTVISTQAGWIGISFSPIGLKRLTLPCKSQRDAEIQLHVKPGVNTSVSHVIDDIEKQLNEYFNGRLTMFQCDLDLTVGTSFQHDVWEKAMSIPYGEIRSYGWLANEIGKIGANRAVGQALAKNPVPIIVPCHRVIYSGGELGGFGGRANIREFKRKLLILEGATIHRDLVTCSSPKDAC